MDASAGCSAAEALAVLKTLVCLHGAPLALKSDNGSAFTSEAFHAWLAEWEIEPLFSPVRMPRYNGACEASIGGANRRTECLAARRNRPLDWTCDDLYAAQLWANEDRYPDGLAAGMHHHLAMNYRLAPEFVRMQQYLIKPLEPSAKPSTAQRKSEDGDGECRIFS